MKNYIIIIFIALNCLIIESCFQQGEQTPKKSSVNYKREKELIEVLHFYHVPTKKVKIVVMPPTRCASCKLGVFKVLDTLQNAYILANDSSIFYAKTSSQTCIYCDPEYIARKGLFKFYPEIVYIENEKVVRTVPLLN